MTRFNPIILLLAISTCGCVPKFTPSSVIILTGVEGITVTKTGRVEFEGLFQDREIPIAYELITASGIVIEFEVGNTVWPSLEMSAHDSNSGGDLTVRSKEKYILDGDCKGEYSVFTKEKRTTFTWWNATCLSEDGKEVAILKLLLTADDGSVIDQVSIPTVVVPNGTYFSIDSV